MPGLLCAAADTLAITGVCVGTSKCGGFERLRFAYEESFGALCMVCFGGRFGCYGRRTSLSSGLSWGSVRYECTRSAKRMLEASYVRAPHKAAIVVLVAIV